MPEEYTISTHEMSKALHKAPGPDGIPNWILERFNLALTNSVCAIMNSSIRNGVVPSQWKCVNLTPLAKSTPPQSIEDDLQPISLTAQLSKCTEKFVAKWFLSDIINKLDICQHGALPGSSTVTAMVQLMHDLYIASDSTENYSHRLD